MKHSSAQQLEIASYIKSHSQTIMQQWESNVRQAADPSLKTTKLALRKNFADLLVHLADSFASEAPKHTAKKNDRPHKIRNTETMPHSITQLLNEYSFLRQTILEILDPVFSLSANDRKKFFNAIETELCAAATAFIDSSNAVERKGRLIAEAKRNLAQAESESLQKERNRSLMSVKKLEKKIHTLESDSIVKAQFVTTLSHDLRNPIGASKMAAKLLLRFSSDDPEAQQFGQILVRSLNRAESMLLDLLDMSQVRAGHSIPLNLKLCELTKIIVESFDEITANEGEYFNFSPSGPAYGYWSQEHLHRAISNLCGNALKYGDRSRPMTISIDQGTKQTEIRVHNFGRIIPEDEQSQLFVPFSRLKEAKKEYAKGWGIGLAFVKEVAEAHGGHTSVGSNSGEGTTFTITIPNDARPFHPSRKGRSDEETA